MDSTSFVKVSVTSLSDFLSACSVSFCVTLGLPEHILQRKVTSVCVPNGKALKLLKIGFVSCVFQTCLTG